MQATPRTDQMSTCDPGSTTINDLPIELLSTILLDESYLPPHWRFCARATCRLWRNLFDAAGRETRCSETAAETRRLDVVCRQGDDVARSIALAKWRRGVCVCASAVVWWARQGHWDDDEASLVTWCAGIPGSSLRCAAGVLVATARPALVRHAVESVVDACAYTSQNPSRWGSHCLSRCPSRDDLTQRLFLMAVHTGDIPTASSVCAAFHPSLDWVMGFVDELVVGDQADTVEWTLHRFAARGTHGPNRAANWLDHLCEKLWTWSAYAGSGRIIARLVALAGGAAAATHESDLVSVAPAASSSSHGKESSVAATTTSFIQTALDRTLWPIMDECISEAVLERHVTVLGALAPRIPTARFLRVLKQAVRAWRVPVARWALAMCRSSGVSVDMDDIMGRALNPYFTVNDRRFTREHEELLSWLCDPGGGGYDPAPEAVPSLLSKAVGGGAVRCLFWAAQHWAPKLAVLPEADITNAVALLVRHGCRQTLDPVSSARVADACTLERLVHVLDALAAHSRSVSCNLWSVLVGLASCDRQGLDAVRHAWTRATGGAMADDDAILCAREPGGPAPARSWARWCRVAPVPSPLVGINKDDKGSKAGAARALADWLDQHGLLLAQG
ncbi:F-box incomplete domain containing protein [Pandoravirus salinus]|uniref:F-box incomplete domain containing protein n=1 Tax=Pandoravirus salinus TaxID=1349410 RepID=S4VSZ2_9VIRU|nr:F-box incomplete domain [Pandoravirus salinus]AGO83554.1 F-box incomplete domain containing protein [Pandoravirus salinus]